MLSGRVVDQNGDSVIGASLAVRSTDGAAIVAFDLSGNEGRFQIRHQQSTDSVHLTVTHLNFDDWVAIVSSSDSTLLITVRTRSYDLPELVVKQEAVVRRGDTLSYDANQLKKPGDENVEQLLSNIPGITVSPQGAIKYQGLPISKFYVEGLDLLEGRYSLATRNLRAETVRDIEVLEHHQHIRALDSLERPPNAAINLRLKSNITLTGQAEAAGGLRDRAALYNLESILFGFTKRQQLNLAGSLNNTGEDLSGEFTNLYETQWDEFEILVEPTLAISPVELPSALYLDNREKSAGVNFLRQTKNKHQWKFGGLLSYDDQNIDGSLRSVLGQGSSAATIQQQLAAQAASRQISSRMSYEVNKKKLYLNTGVNVELTSNQTNTNDAFNGEQYQQVYGATNQQLHGFFNTIIRKGKKAYRMEGFARYVNSSTNLAIDTVRFDLPDEFLLLPLRLNQHARQRSLQTDVSTVRYSRKGRLVGRSRIGLSTQSLGLQSSLSEQATGQPISSRFANDVSQRYVSPYLNQTFVRTGKGITWTLDLPLSLRFLRLDATAESTSRQTLPVAVPKLIYERQLKQQRTLTADYSYSFGYDESEILYGGYLLRGVGFFDRKTATINRQRTHRLGLEFRGQDRTNTFRYQVTSVAARTTADQLLATNFTDDGTENTLLTESNTQQQFHLKTRLGYTAIPATTLRLMVSNQLRLFPIAINGVRTRSLINEFTFSSELGYAFSKSALTAQPKLTWFSGTVNSAESIRLNVRTAYFHQFGRWGDVRIQHDLYATRAGQLNVNNHFLSLSYERPVLAKQYALAVKLDNVTNTERFLTYTQLTYGEEFAFYRLRGRQVRVVVTRKL